MNTNTKPLSIKKVSKSYGDLQVLSDFSLDINEGEIFGLLGPNGAGKSTVINMVVGVSRIDSGNIEIFGYDNQREYLITRRLTGVMHQELVIEQFFNVGTILSIHSGYYGVPDDPKWRKTLIERLQLGPHLKKRYIHLSGGMKRRLMIAKALVHKPKLLILDEPTAGVDVELRRSLWEFVREINKQGTTIVLTTHYIEEAEEMCDRIAIMNHGEIVALEETPKLVNAIGKKKIIITLKESFTTLPEHFPDAEITNGGKKLVFCVDSSETVLDILNRVQKGGFEILDVETSHPALEDVFLRLTKTQLS